MIIHHGVSACYNSKKSHSTSSQFKANYHDDFRFEMPRGSDVTITSETDTASLKEDFIDDCENGIWKGWVFANILTERNPDIKVQAFYLEVNRNYVTYRSHVGGDLIFLKPTKQMKLICENSEGPCTPTEYLQMQSKDVPFDDLLLLKDTIINYFDQLPGIEERGCMILEFEEPKTRCRVSEIVCSLFPEDGETLITAFANAYYLSLLRADVSMATPAISYMTESIIVKIWEEKRLMEDVIVFNEMGILKANSDILLYAYSSIANDQLGNRCAFWYRNLMLPEEFEDHDPNCCLTFLLKTGKSVFICSNYPRRCIMKGKMILLQMKIGCEVHNKAHMTNPYENENTASPLRPVDNYFKVLYDDSTNGIWRGLVFHHKLGLEETVSANPHFMKIENGYISFYLDENYKNNEGIELEPKEKLVIRNMYFTCEQEFTCDLSHYLEYFKETISNDGFDLFKLKKDVQQVTGNLPVDSNFDECCTIISFKDENSIKTDYIICTRVPEQGQKIKLTLTKSLNKIILNSNIIREIPLALLEDSFQIQYFDAQAGKVLDFNVRFGKYYMFDSDSGQSILKYTEVKDDSYGTKCAIWNSQLTLPKQMTVESKECCFMYNKNDLSYYVCSDGNYHCLKKARIMMKTVKEGCLAQAKGLALNGIAQLDVPEIRNPYTEVLGYFYYFYFIFIFENYNIVLI